MEWAIEAIPFHVNDLECDSGSEFLNHEFVAWSGETGYLLRPFAFLMEKRSSLRGVQEQPCGLPLRFPLMLRRCSSPRVAGKAVVTFVPAVELLHTYP